MELDDLNSISVLDTIKNYIKSKSIPIQQIINSLQNNFQEKYCIITNSKDNTKTTQEETTKDIDELLNSLEEIYNPIRAIFTVKKLEEGWDVLNLYDIVRLYNEQNTGGANKGKSGSSTVSEVQLIGRGVRYFPFSYKDTIPYMRKFDMDKSNELRILEEFHFHSTYQSSYITDLKNKLKNKGLITPKTITRSFHIKDEIRKKSSFYKNYKIAINQRIENPNKRKKNIMEILSEINRIYTFNSQITEEKEIFGSDQVINTDSDESLNSLDFKFKDNKHVILKVFSKLNSNFYTFENLKEYLEISSIDDIFKDDIFGEQYITISSNSMITTKQIYNSFESFFKKFESKIKEYHNPYKGTKLTFSKIKDEFSTPKYKSIDIDREIELQRVSEQLVSKNWYVLDKFYGNKLEEEFTKFFNDSMLPILKQKGFDEIYFLRNEEVYKVYDFETGNGFQPDFLLFVKKSNSNITYQCFFEIKGSHLTQSDLWKENFLVNLSDDDFDKSILKIERENFKLVGFPFYSRPESKNDYKNKIENFL
ncbi:MAG: hypothetical protein ACMXYB_01240 [Candidatus Woesearchaeota archaeon]